MGLLTNVCRSAVIAVCLLVYRLSAVAFPADAPPEYARLVHTRLEISFDYPQHLVHGKAWITLQAALPRQDSLVLDAKSMEVTAVTLQKGKESLPLPYKSTGTQLLIELDKPYGKDEQYTVHVAYTARPDALSGSVAGPVQTTKGIYFIPAGSDNEGPLFQVWTQGETSGASSWFPTIDKPDQRSTSEISITVPAKYRSLSNGVLKGQQEQPNGTRTDTWSMTSPHAPYLFMLAVGKFEVVHDTWNGLPVDYYMEPEYSAYAKQIFGDTPKMLSFFTEKLGYKYPWPGYAQIVVKDYFSGGMENTTATLFGDLLRRNPRALLGDEDAKWVIPHELFHQWFGDLVTCEEWSQLALNESFANFGEVLWGEYAYSKDEAHHHSYESMLKYFQQHKEGNDHPLIYKTYKDETELFDAVTYEKGGNILSMLRDLVGEDKFFTALRSYLSENAFKAVDAEDLRTAFEKASGSDLKWFWDQWFYRDGFPVLDISYDYNDAEGTVAVKIDQQQKGDIFILPLKVDLYTNGKRTTQDIKVDNRTQVFTLAYPDKNTRPQLVNVDAGKHLICKKTDRKPLETFIYQYKYAGNYLDRREALKACIQAQDTSAIARAFLRTGLHDVNDRLRKITVQYTDLENADTRKAYVTIIDSLARYDTEPLVRQAAVKSLRSLKDPAYKALFVQSLKDSCYNVVASALIGLNQLDKKLAAQQMTPFLEDNEMASTILDIYLDNEDAKDNQTFLSIVSRQRDRQKQDFLVKYLRYLSTLNDVDAIDYGLKQFQQIAASINDQLMDKKGMLGNLELLAGFKMDLLKKTAGKKERSSLEKQVASIQQTIHDFSLNMD